MIYYCPPFFMLESSNKCCLLLLIGCRDRRNNELWRYYHEVSYLHFINQFKRQTESRASDIMLECESKFQGFCSCFRATDSEDFRILLNAFFICLHHRARTKSADNGTMHGSYNNDWGFRCDSCFFVDAITLVCFCSDFLRAAIVWSVRRGHAWAEISWKQKSY